MVLESVIVCIDNSEFSRNGDYFPTRLEAQKDAGLSLIFRVFCFFGGLFVISNPFCLFLHIYVGFFDCITASILSTHRLESNPESTCGCIGMAGQGLDIILPSLLLFLLLKLTLIFFFFPFFFFF